MVLNNHEKGLQRDLAILREINSFKILDTEQVYYLLFRDEPNGKRKAQRRLQSLHKRKKLTRGRDFPRVPYYYYIGKKPGQIDHRLGVNWVYCWFRSKLKQWEELTFDREPIDYGFI